MALNSLAFLKGIWLKPSREETAAYIRQFGDAIDEINYRGLDMRDFSPRLMSEADRTEVYMGLPQELAEMLS